LSLCIVILYWREEGRLGRVQRAAKGRGDPEMRQFTLRKGQGWGFAAMYKELLFQVRGFFLSKQFTLI
jgi:hypothetical protein